MSWSRTPALLLNLIDGGKQRRCRAGGALSKTEKDTRTIYAALRAVVRFFAGFLIFIIAVVAWRKLWVEGKSLVSLEYGELVSLGILAAIAIALWLFAAKLKREITDV